MTYAHVADDGTITPYSELPDVWVGVSGFHTMGDAGLAEYGFLPVVATQPEAEAGQSLDGPAYTVQGGQVVAAWTARDMTDAEVVQARSAKLQAAVWARDAAASTFSYAGHAGVSANDQAQSRAANTAAMLDKGVALKLLPPSATVGWEIVSGVFLDMDATALATFGVAMGLHVQACWAVYRQIAAGISAATPADLATIDVAAGYPAN